MSRPCSALDAHLCIRLSTTLCSDGLVEVIPRKGVIVKPVSLDEVMQMIEVRMIIEPQAARLAAERADEKDIAALSDTLARAEQWTAVRNIEQMMLLDREFHSHVARAARNTVFAGILGKLHERSLRFWFISLTAPDHHFERPERAPSYLERNSQPIPAKPASQCISISSCSERTSPVAYDLPLPWRLWKRR